MNLVGTLAKVAVGVLVARGVGKMVTRRKNGGSGAQPDPIRQGNDTPGGVFGDLNGDRGPGGVPLGTTQTGQSHPAGDLGDLLENLTRGKTPQTNSPDVSDLLEKLGRGSAGQESGVSLEDLLENLKRGDTSQQASGGLGGLLGKVLAGSTQRRGSDRQQGGGGLGDLLESLKRSSTPQRQQPGSGGLGDLGGILGKVLSGAGGSGGGLGRILDGLGGSHRRSGSTDSFGDLFNDALGGKPLQQVKPEQNAQAGIMLRGMINAAKCDGQIDKAEQATILENLGEVRQEEIDFVRDEMARPLDIHGFIRSVPKGLESQVYMMSLLGIKLDSRAEAEYLDHLAQGLGISHDVVNQIHAQVGAPALYTRSRS